MEIFTRHGKKFVGFLLYIRPLKGVRANCSVHPYCTRKFTYHVMHRARARSTEINNDMALLGFHDLKRTVTLTFLFKSRFYLQLSPHCPNMNKKSMWEGKKNHDFCQRDFESCSHAAAKRVKL